MVILSVPSVRNTVTEQGWLCNVAFLVRAVMDMQNPHVIVFKDHTVMLEIRFYRVLSDAKRRRKKARQQ